MSRRAHTWHYILNPLGSKRVVLVGIRPKPMPVPVVEAPRTERKSLHVRSLDNPNKTIAIKDYITKQGHAARSVTFHGAYEYYYDNIHRKVCLYKYNDVDLLYFVDRITPSNLKRCSGYFTKHPGFVSASSHELGEHVIVNLENLSKEEINFIWA